MKCVYLPRPREVEIRDIQAPRCGPDDVMIRVRAGGVCGSDMSSYQGQHFLRMPPVILGHEVAGDVVEVGTRVARWHPGDHAAIEPQIPCGKCEYCRTGLSTICSDKQMVGRDFPGLLSELVVMPAASVHRIDDHVAWEAAAMVEPAAVSYRAVRLANVRDGTRVAILGAGPIGALAALILARLHDVQVTVFDFKQSNLDLVTRLTGYTTVNLSETTAAEAGSALSEGRGYATVFVANSAPASLMEAVDLCRPNARIIAIGATYREPPPVNVPQIVVRELELKGTLAYTGEDFRATIELIEQGLDVAALITGRYPYEEAPTVLDALAAGTEHVKTMFTFE
jgi:L-iditol 2-dehydrogenase